MNQECIVIVGGGPAGLSTARAYRQAGGSGAVTILTTEPYPPYNRPPLTKDYLRGGTSREELPMEPERWYEENAVELRLMTHVSSLDRDRRVVETEGGEFPYDVCVLATGSEPVRLPVQGADDPDILVMRTIENSTRLQARINRGSPVVVVGSGFIGCEAAASLSMRGAEVTLVSLEERPQIERLGEQVAERIEGWLEGYGVELRCGSSVSGIERRNGGYEVGVEDGPTLSAETVLFGTGVRPRTEIAEMAGLEVVEGGIVSDSSMRTSAPGVFAVGDVSFAYNEAAARRLHVEHWGEALNHGRVAGTVVAGGEAAWDVAPGFWSTVGEQTLKYVAWGEGFDDASFVDHGGGAFTCWYGSEGVCVGVLTHDHDEDYERGRKLVESGAPLPV
ncbi:MAG: NAD(P)/FAD-dependent oxidoreductase [Rubrobacteraceae bacterium]